jgi:hypothetical protein
MRELDTAERRMAFIGFSGVDAVFAGTSLGRQFPRGPKTMQILLFARDGIGEHIREAVVRTVPETQIFNVMGGLVSRIMNLSTEPVVAVLIAGSKGEFAEIQLMKWLLNDICIVLILPDRDLETVAEGYDLHPRFMGCLDDDADEIAAVLCKMLTRERAGQTRPHAEH